MGADQREVEFDYYYNRDIGCFRYYMLPKIMVTYESL